MEQLVTLTARWRVVEQDVISVNKVIVLDMSKVNNFGFTLVELLIVIAIMSILTSITVSQFVTAKKKANDVSRKSDLNGISKALQMYFTDYGAMPDADANGKILVKGNPLEWGSEFVDGSYVYMKVLPKENNTNLPAYCYKTDEEKKKYALFAKLENTSDKECEGHAYTCENGTSNKTYCFAYVSPNTSLKPNGDFQ